MYFDEYETGIPRHVGSVVVKTVQPHAGRSAGSLWGGSHVAKFQIREVQIQEIPKY